MEIVIYEDNAGSVYLGNGDEIWDLGPVTSDMYGTALDCASAWMHGEWAPNEQDGQTRAGAGGRCFLGLET